MALTRRGFLGLVSTGIVGACVVSKIPTGWIPQPIRTRAACEFMRKAYNQYIAYGGQPTEVLIGPELYQAFENELVCNHRFCFTEDEANPFRGGLLFKGVPVYVQDGLGWTVRVIGMTNGRLGVPREIHVLR